MLIDDTQEIARLLDVKRTAETICIDTSHWTVFYRGALDDQLVEGAQKPEPTEKYVENALNQFLAAKSITRPKHGGARLLDHFRAVRGAKAPSRFLTSTKSRRCCRASAWGATRPGNIAPFAMSSYQKVRGRADMIREVLVARRMPPWDADPRYGHFKNDRSLTLAQKKTVVAVDRRRRPARMTGPIPWPKPLPEAPRWPLGQPDYIVKLPGAAANPGDRRVRLPLCRCSFSRLRTMSGWRRPFFVRTTAAWFIT